MLFKSFRIGKYEFVELLGRGGMAEVYRVRTSGAAGFQKEFAVKRVLPEQNGYSEMRALFEEEARLSSILTHPNIVQVFEFFRAGENYLLVMEYVNGRNLAQLAYAEILRGGRVPLGIALWIINEAAKGVDYAHRKIDPRTRRPLGLIHRDLSPTNIMVGYEGGVKVVDFGIAKAKHSVPSTGFGAVRGNIPYMSPEQAQGAALDQRTDVYSLAIVLLELLSTRRLFTAPTPGELLAQVRSPKLPPLQTLVPSLSDELHRVLSHALTPSPESRCATMGRFQHDLQDFLARHFPALTQQSVQEYLRELFPSGTPVDTWTHGIVPLTQLEEDAVLVGFNRLESALNAPVTRTRRLAAPLFLVGAAIVAAFAAREYRQVFTNETPRREITEEAPPPPPVTKIPAATPPPAPVNAVPLTPQKRYEQGLALLKRKKYEEARQIFHGVRVEAVDFLPAWFSEIRALENANRKKEAGEVARELLKAYPKLKALPQLKPYL